MTKVVALERGHDGRVVREPGEQFEVDLEDARFKSATWFAPVGSPAEAKAKAAEAKKADPKARPPGAGPAKGSAVEKSDDLV